MTQLEQTHSQLKAIRERTDLRLKKLKHLRDSFTLFEGDLERPLSLRYYQIQGALHLLAMSRFVLGDACGLGKTLQTIAALCCLWEQQPRMKAIVITTRSSSHEWEAEFLRFTQGIRVFKVPNFAALPPRKQKPLSDFEARRFQEILQVQSPEILATKGYQSLCFLLRQATESKDLQLLQLIRTAGVKLLKGESIPEEDKTALERALKNNRILTLKGQDRRVRECYEPFFAETKPSVLILNYAKAVNDFTYLLEHQEHSLVFDECTAFKNTASQTHKRCRALATRAARVWGLTATLIKNDLTEGFGIYRVIEPSIFPTLKRFHEEHCVIEWQPVPGSRKKIPKVVNHTREHVRTFKDKIDPFFLGRPKHKVAKELPVIETRVVHVDMYPAQRALYEEVLTGLLQIARGGTEEIKETTKLTQIIYCQQASNHPALLGREGESAKFDRLMELLEEGDLAEEKVVVYTRFKSMVDILEPALAKKNIPCVRITGDEKDNERKEAMRKFQHPHDPHRVCFITQAGSEAINLQRGRAIIYYDTPFSGGEFVQSLGRIDRIGSEYDMVYCIHLVARESVDVRVMQVLRRKKKLMEAVLGKIIKDSKDDGDDFVSSVNDISDLFKALEEDAKNKRT